MQPPRKTVWRSLKKLNTDAPCGPTVPLLGVYPQRSESRDLENHLSTHTRSGVIHRGQRVEATRAAIDGRAEKQNVVHPFNGVLFSLKREGHSDAGYNMDGPWGRDAQ